MGKKKRKKRKRYEQKNSHKIQMLSYLEPLPEELVNQLPLLMLEYYNRPFKLLHIERTRDTADASAPHIIRNRFWQFVPQREYDLHEARILLQRYASSVESEMARIIGNSSLAYWLHLYRRIAPGAIGKDKDPMTVGITRAVLEAAIQKYSGSGLCNRVGGSKDVPIEKIFGGLLTHPDFEHERMLLTQSGNQLVLTNFTHVDLEEFYQLEKLAYEIWRTGAILRTIGKGAPFVVEDAPQFFYDDRSDELNMLLESYDSRNPTFSVSAVGAVFDGPFDKTQKRGIGILPTYNLMQAKWNVFAEPFHRFCNIPYPDEMIFNFVWVPFNLRGFWKVHQPLADAFEEKHGLALDAVLTIVAALCLRVSYYWIHSKGSALYRFWQRAYEATFTKEEIMDQIQRFLSAALELLDLPSDRADSLDIESAFHFWTLSDRIKNQIDLVYPGPHSIFLPFRDNRFFVDYTWIDRRLFDLFFGVSIPDQNFKGDALERIVRKQGSALPQQSCKAANGEQRQFDYATGINGHLVVAECKAVGRSIGFDRGDPMAIEYRTNTVVERSLSEIDKKARWLANNLKGLNYDVTGYEYILPVAVSPFVEFIPSLNPRYWISETLPRVLAPDELIGLLRDVDTVVSSYNRIRIAQTDQA